MEEMRKDKQVMTYDDAADEFPDEVEEEKEDYSSVSNIRFNCFRNPSSKYDFVKVFDCP